MLKYFIGVLIMTLIGSKITYEYQGIDLSQNEVSGKASDGLYHHEGILIAVLKGSKYPYLVLDQDEYVNNWEFFTRDL